MLSKEQLDQLPDDVKEFIAQEPTKLEEIQHELGSYDGRLVEVVKNITPQEIVDFQDFLHQRISEEQKESEIMMIAETLRPDYNVAISEVNPREIFDMTPYRSLEGLTLTRIPLDDVARALWQKNLIMEAFNHPLRIKVRKLYQDEFKNRPHGYSPFDPLPELRVPPLTAQELQDGPLHTFSEMVMYIPGGKKVSRQLNLAIGVYAPIGRDQIAIPFGSETMQFVIGNPIALADIVRCHGIATVPRNGPFADARQQGQLLLDTLKVLQQTPLLQADRADKQLIWEQWINNLGILVEPNPYKACDRIQTVITMLEHAGYPAETLGHVRVYMVEGSDEMVDTAQIIEKFFPWLHHRIHVGMAINRQQIREADSIEAASIGLGIASGSGCDTGSRTGAPTQNFNFLYKINDLRIGTPLFSETGIPHHAAPIALGSGIRRINYTAGILGFLSANGGHYAFRDRSERFVGSYDSEAGQEAKHYEKREYPWEMPAMLEGKNGSRIYDPEYPTIAHRLWYLSETVVLTDAFHRHIFPEDLVYDPDKEFNLMSHSMMDQVRPFNHF